MEKDAGSIRFSRQHKHNGRRWSLAVAQTFIFCAFILYLLFSSYSYFKVPLNPSKRPTKDSSLAWPTEADEFDWNQINPTTYLNYTSCFGKFQCTRLDVPMDWNETSSGGPRVTIAIIRLPAPAPVIDPRYGGVIVTNPGGPGGSGVFHALRSGEKLATIINPGPLELSGPDSKYFDILSFDPRGVNNTTPSLKCFPDTSSFDVWRYQAEGEGIGPGTPLSRMWARAKASTSQCSQSGGITHHMNTPPVVADMVEIIERHGEWRSKEAELMLASMANPMISAVADNSHNFKQAVTERTRWRKGEEKLLYWGFSYGTLLGATFAALQPHRVDRVILDGVEEATDYYSTAWALNLRDTDKIIDKFYEYCSLAGPKKCAFNFGTSDPADIKKSFELLISDIKEDPIAVPGTSTRGPEIITYSDVMEFVRLALYRPRTQFPILASILADLKGNGSATADFKAQQNKPSCPLQHCSENVKSESCYPEVARQSTSGILCSDGADFTDRTKYHFKEYATSLSNQSRWLGEYWVTVTLNCYHWKAKAAWRVKSEDIKGNTSHPILWIGNTLDPVTPLSNAYIMSKKFPASVVLEQNSEGHCSESSPSLCTAKIVKDYFQTGKLPKPGTVCEPNELPLVGNVTQIDDLSVEDKVLLDAMRGIADDMTTSKGLGS